jgi:hypothetical protein
MSQPYTWAAGNVAPRLTSPVLTPLTRLAQDIRAIAIIVEQETSPTAVRKDW